MALYLKYRPRTFPDVAGQDHVVTTLEQAVSQGQIGHAYLFCGSRGTGKTSVARILAKSILLQGVKDEAMKKEMTEAIESGSFIDCIEIDAASNRKIEDVRDLIEKVGFSPVIAKAKVYIIDEAHMLTKESFNALLKTLEEPPDYAYFILATTELHKVPETIQSRCQRFLFKRVKDDDIIRRLQYIADREHIKTDREALRAIARHASGSFRDGIGLLDQLRSLEKITMKDVEERTGSSLGSFLEDIVAALQKRDAAELTAIVQKIEESNTPLDLIASELLSLIRNQMHEAIAKKASIAPFIRAADILLAALRDMRSSPVPGLVLEAALLSLIIDLPEQETAKIQAAAALQSDQKKKSGKQEAEEPAKETAAPKKEGLLQAEEFTLGTVKKHWDTVLKGVSPASVKMSLKNGTPIAVEGSRLTIAFPSGFHKDKVADLKASRAIEETLTGIFKLNVRIECVLEDESRPSTAGPSTDLVEAAEEVFGGF